jgi:hypothetical protein
MPPGADFAQGRLREHAEGGEGFIAGDSVAGCGSEDECHAGPAETPVQDKRHITAGRLWPCGHREIPEVGIQLTQGRNAGNHTVAPGSHRVGRRRAAIRPR